MGIIFTKNYAPPPDLDENGKPYQGFAGYAGSDCGCGCAGAPGGCGKGLAGFGDAWSYGVVEGPQAPSRMTWFVLGAAVAFLGPSLLAVIGAGGRRAAAKLEPKKA